MANVLRWQYGVFYNVYSVEIEESIDAITFVPLSEVEAPIAEYEHASGDTNTWYRMRLRLYKEVNDLEITFDVDTKSLGHTDIQPDSIVVLGSGLQIYLEGIDFTVDYALGEITRLPGGGIPAAGTIEVDFKYLEYTDYTLPKKVLQPAWCRVYGYIATADGYPLEGEKIYFRTYNPPQAVGVQGLNVIPVIVPTQGDGWFEVNLLQNSVVNIKNHRLGIDQDVVIPAQDSADLYSIITI